MLNLFEIIFTLIIAMLFFIFCFILGIKELNLLILLLISILILIRLFIIAPIQKIIKKLEDIEKGSIPSEISTFSIGEINILIKSFNSMLNYIHITQNGLNKKIEDLSVINQISQAMSSTNELDEILKLIIVLTRDTIKAETVSLMLVEHETNELVIKMAIGMNEVVMRRRMKIGEGISGWVALHGEPLLIQDIEKDGRFKRKSSKKYATKSLLSVPLIAKGSVIGVLNVNNKSSNQVFTESDLSLLVILANQAAQAIETTRLLKVSVAKKSLDQQIEIAREIQMQLLPRKLPDIRGIDIGVLSIPAKEIGGDYCDVIDIPVSNSIGITMGDVSGKGIPASLLMVMLRSFLKIECINKISPAKVLSVLNELIIADNKIYSEIFITLFYGVINRKELTLTYTNAGHEPIYLFHRSNGSFETLKTGDLVLGIFPGIIYHENAIQLQKGDLIILYTDGIIEARNPNHEVFGDERFIRTVFKNIKKKGINIKDAIYNEVQRFSGKGIQNDDIALLTIDIDYVPEEFIALPGINWDISQMAMVITFMDKWYTDVIQKATIKILQTMKDKNIIPKDENINELASKSIFFKRSMEDIPDNYNENVKILKINLRAIFDYIFIVDIINEELGKANGFDDDAVYEWTVAIKEAVLNAISYGTDFDKEEWVGIYYHKEQNKITVCVRDHGRGFDANKLKDTKNQNMIFSEHGRGIIMIKNFMDEVKFNSNPERGTEVIMVKYFQQKSEIEV